MRQEDRYYPPRMQGPKDNTLEALGRAAGAAAHDFNNLLTVIQGYAGLLLRTLPPDDPSRASLEEIQRATERGRKLTQELTRLYRKAVPEDARGG